MANSAADRFSAHRHNASAADREARGLLPVVEEEPQAPKKSLEEIEIKSAARKLFDALNADFPERFDFIDEREACQYSGIRKLIHHIETVYLFDKE